MMPLSAPPTRPPAVVARDTSATRGAQRYESLIHSAFLDSLEQLTGRPKVYRYGTTPAKGALAQYTFHVARGQPTTMGADTVTMSPALMDANALGQAPRPSDEQRSATSPEYVLAHELGHRSRIVAAMVNGGSPTRSAVRREQDATFRDRQPDAPDGAYWAENAHEHHAEAFANAVQYLRATAGIRAHPDQLARVEPTMSRYEQAVPGTAQMVTRLLQHPLYTNHPILRAMRPQRAAADATATASLPTSRAP
jgi:hypothetical protein